MPSCSRVTRSGRSRSRGPARAASRPLRPSSPTWFPSIGTTGTGFLQNDATWRQLERLPAGDLASPFYISIEVEDRPGVLAHIARQLAAHDVSVARLIQSQADGGALMHVVTHEAPEGRVAAALAEISALPEARGRASALPVISDRGVAELGWA